MDAEEDDGGDDGGDGGEIFRGEFEVIEGEEDGNCGDGV